MRFKLLLITLLVSCLGWGQGSYSLVSSTSDLVAGGKYIIVSGVSGTVKAMSSQNTNNRASVDVSIITNSIISTSVAINSADVLPFEITLGGSTGAWTLYDNVNNLYLSATSSSSNNFNGSASSSGRTWTISINSNVATLTSLYNNYSRNVLKCNISNNPPLFSCYSTGQNSVYLFKKVIQSTTYTTTWSNSVPTSTIDAIINGDLSTSVDLACKDLTINAGKTLTIEAGKKLTVSGNLINNGSIVFKSDATATAMLDVFNGTVTGTGKATVERYIPAKRAYRFVSPSVTTTTSINQNWQETLGAAAGLGTHITGADGATNGFDATATNNPSLYTFNATTAAWEPVVSTTATTLFAGTAYRLMVRGDRTTDLTNNTATATATTLRATGTLKTGNFVPVINQTADGFSLVGNPYQAPIDIKAILTASSNMNTGVVYYWDPTLNARGGYVTRDLTANTNDVTSNFNQYLQPGQAVFVKRDNTANVASMTFLESNKSIANAAAGVFRNADSTNFGILRANLKTSIDNQWTTIEGALALFNPSFSSSVTQEDASKMSNLDEEVSFVQNNTALAIACQQNPSITDELPIKFNNIRHSDYQWQFELDNYNGTTPYLFDSQNNTFTAITDGTIVPFTADATTTNRFKIVFQNAALNNPEFATTIVVYPNPAKSGSSFVLQGVSPKSSVVLYTTLGQSIAVSTTEYETGLQVTPKTLISSGVYIVSITTEGKTSQVKWIVE